MKAFPLRFDFSPEVWCGARARLHSAREDAVQQLVGDALRISIPGFVSTFSTAGRDGSIDAFIETSAPLPDLFSDVPPPIIVECKDNDDRRDDIVENVSSAWRKLSEKLERKASEKWPDLYQPWIGARGYIYATSATLPHKKARDDLCRKIQSFFDHLRALNLCGIEKVRVVDWTDLRHFFDSCPGLADRWLGVDVPTLLEHEHRAHQLTGFSRYLLDLPFVEPSSDHQAHPGNIFNEAVMGAGKQGVLLVGAGGVGKTRTLLEVANLAAMAGWRVLHTAGWGRGLTQDELFREILDGHADALLIVDYLSQLKEIDFQWVRARLLPAAVQRGVKLGIVAAERPAYAAQTDEHRRRYFKCIRLEPDVSQTDRIVETMLDHVAKHAVQALGRDRVRRLAGRRPIIALFVMQELERRALNTPAGDRASITVRSADLLGWLGARLDEDSLAPRQPTSIWARGNSGPELLASAAVLCAAPQPRQSLVAIANHVLSSLADTTRTAAISDAVQIVDVLLELGWLELRDDALSAAHDVVAEEVLLRALHDGSRNGFSEQALRHVLAPSTRSSKILLRTAIVLERVAGVDPQAAQFLAASMAQWIIEHAVNIGSSLLPADGDVADMVIYTLFSNQSWADAASNCYVDIVQPFIERHGARLNAALPLIQLLGHARLSSKNFMHLCNMAIAWCRQHIDSDVAHLVARIMLMCSDIPVEIARDAVDVAHQIALKDFSEGRVPLVGALLARPELGRIRGHELIRLVRGDMVSYAHRCGARQVASSSEIGIVEHFDMILLMKSLLEHCGASIDLSPDVLDCAIASLWHWRRGEGAAWVLPAMLRRHSKLGSRLGVVRKIARRWLNTYAADQFASGVLAAVCAEPDALDRPVILGDAVLDWLDRHGSSPEAATLLYSALGSGYLQEGVKRHAETQAFHWLTQHAGNYMAGNVIIALLKLPDLSDAAAKEAIAHATAWVGRHLHLARVSFVLDPLFQRNDLDAETRLILTDYSIQWLSRHTDDETALLVIRALLRDSGLPLPQLEKTMRLALSWCSNHREQWTSGAALLELFGRIHRTKNLSISTDILLELVNLAIWWLRQHETSSIFGAVIVAFAWSGTFPTAGAVHIMEPTFKWLLRLRGQNGIEVQTAKGLLRHCVENASDQHRAAMRHMCESITESLPERAPGEHLLVELGLAANFAAWEPPSAACSPAKSEAPESVGDDEGEGDTITPPAGNPVRAEGSDR